MEQIMNQLYSIEFEKYKCPICHDIAFPPVKLFIKKPTVPNTPVCNHIYCLSCIRTYYQLDKKISDRKVNRFECLICQQPLITGSTICGVPKNANDVYYHCSDDDNKVINLLVYNETNGQGKQCLSCDFKTCHVDEMKQHMRHLCENMKIKCIHDKCNYYDYRREVIEHQDQCKYKPIQCKLCNVKKGKGDLTYHYHSFHRVLDVNNKDYLFLD